MLPDPSTQPPPLDHSIVRRCIAPDLSISLARSALSLPLIYLRVCMYCTTNAVDSLVNKRARLYLLVTSSSESRLPRLYRQFTESLIYTIEPKKRGKKRKKRNSEKKKEEEREKIDREMDPIRAQSIARVVADDELSRRVIVAGEICSSIIFRRARARALIKARRFYRNFHFRTVTRCERASARASSVSLPHPLPASAMKSGRELFNQIEQDDGPKIDV